jgi:hypothetical protein
MSLPLPRRLSFSYFLPRPTPSPHPLPEINGPARYGYLKADVARQVVTSVFDHGSLLGNIREVYTSMGQDVAKTLAAQDKMQANAEQKEALSGSHVV